MPIAFHGMDSLEDLFRVVVPRRRPGRWLLPIIALYGDRNNVAEVMSAVRTALDGTVVVRCDTVELHQLPEQPELGRRPDDVGRQLELRLTELRRLLYSLWRQFVPDEFGRVPQLRFRRYRLIEWLLSQHLTTSDEKKELASRLRRNFPELGRELVSESASLLALLLGGQVPAAAVRVFCLVVWRFLPVVVFGLLLQGRIRLSGGVYGWIMRQPMAGNSGSLAGFGCRLTIGRRRREDDSVQERQRFYDDVEDLLLNAFLEDLRAEYRWRPWRVWRRTFPVVLLDNIASGSVAERFLNRIDGCRQRGKDDPLLIVADAVGLSNTASPARADRAKRTYEKWVGHLPVDRGLRGTSTWFLWITVPATIPGEPQEPYWSLIPAGRPASPVWWTRSARFMSFVVVVLLVVVTGWEIFQLTRPLPACHTVHDSEWAAVETGTYRDCIGFSAYDPEDPQNDGTGYLFGRRAGQRTEWLTEAQKAIYLQNRKAESQARQPNARPLVTLVYFGQLSNMESYAPEREDLRGLLLAQQDALGPERSSDPSPPRPLIRLVLANTGRNLVDGQRVVSMLTPLLRGANGVVGALASGVSRGEEVSMLRSLAAKGISVIGTTLSADALANSAPTYFQLSAPDKDIAAMIKSYLDSESALSSRNIHIYLPDDPDDLYTNDTAQDMNAALGGAYSVDFRYWDRPGAFAETCDDIIFYAGRDLQFNEFLRKLQVGCPNRNVTLMADDSVNRFMDSTALRAEAPVNKQSLIYVAKASLVACNYPGTQNSVSADNIFRQLAEQHGQCLGVNPGDKDEIGERTALSYDAVQLYMDAVQSLLPRAANMPVNALSVWGALHGLQVAPQLAGGMLNYSPPGDFAQPAIARIPYNKWRGLLRVDNINDQPSSDHRKMIYGCGQIAPSGPFSQGQCRRNPFEESRR